MYSVRSARVPWHSSVVNLCLVAASNSSLWLSSSFCVTDIGKFGWCPKKRLRVLHCYISKDTFIYIYAYRSHPYARGVLCANSFQWIRPSQRSKSPESVKSCKSFQTMSRMDFSFHLHSLSSCGLVIQIRSIVLLGTLTSPSFLPLSDVDVLSSCTSSSRMFSWQSVAIRTPVSSLWSTGWEELFFRVTWIVEPI